MKIRGSLALDQVIAAAEQIDDPKPELMETYDGQLARGEIGQIDYVIKQIALGVALLAWMEPD